MLDRFGQIVARDSPPSPASPLLSRWRGGEIGRACWPFTEEGWNSVKLRSCLRPRVRSLNSEERMATRKEDDRGYI